MNATTMLPQIETALLLEPEELAVSVLECACQYEETMHVPPNRNTIIAVIEKSGYCTRDQLKDFKKVFTEAWVWLEHEGLIAPSPDSEGEYRFVTRRGKQFRKHGDVNKFKAATLLPADTLDPDLAAKVRPPFLRGDYDSVVFEAFKEVEIRVRSLSGLTADDLGVNLMRKAFKPKEGPLSDVEQIEAEQKSIAELFANAIGSFKNPSSHRDVNFADVTEIVELVMFADLLIRIAERRKPRASK